MRKIVRRLRAGVGLAGFLAVAAASLPVARQRPIRRRTDVMAWNCLLWGFAIRIRRHGVPLAGAGVLHVSNHVSWTDIPVLGRLIDAGFVAKSEVAGWPILGALTASYGCLFVERDSRRAVREQAGALAAHLQGNRGMILFAEGTTGLGTEVLPFRSSLFAMVPGAIGASKGGTGQVQPITIRYARADGSPLGADERRAVAWMDDDDLGPHAQALADRGGLVVDVWFEEPLATHEYHSRKALGRACEEVIGRRLKG